MPTAVPSTDASVEAQVFWLRFQKEIAAALVIVLLALVGFSGYRFYKNRQESTAAELLGQAKTPQDYQAVMERYPGTPAGASAYLLLAERQRDEKNYAEANKTLQAFIDKFPEHDFVPTARLTMAANLESMGKNDEALAIYQEVAVKYANNYAGPLALVSEVPLLKAKNRIEDARRVCEEVLTKYRMPGTPQSEGVRDDRMETIWAMEAMRHLRSLKPPEETKPPTTANPVRPAAGNTPPPLLAAPSVAPPPPAGAPTPKKPKQN
jgi:TolA-binding protein